MAQFRPPVPVLWAAGIAALQCVVGLGYAVLLIVRQALGYRDESIVYTTEDANTWVGYGTAVFFLIIFGVVLGGAYLMAKGWRWGRGPVVMLEILLLLISWYMFSGGLYSLAVATLLSSVLALGFLFSPRAVRYAAGQY